MEKKFLAKSDGESIVEHTEELIKNFERLFQMYPDIKVNKKLLLLACIYHDLGKINSKFQGKLYGKKSDREIPHGILSTAFINDDTLLDKYLFKEEDIKILGYAVALHHERDMSEITEDILEEEIEDMNLHAEEFLNKLNYLEKKYEYYLEKTDDFKINEEFKKESIFRIENNQVNLQKPSSLCFDIDNNRIYSKSLGLSKDEALAIFGKYVMLKGLLNRIDYAASSHIMVEEKSDFLEKALEDFLVNVLKKDNSDNEWNGLQNFMKNNRDKNIVTVAQTGYGKTEAGLLWIGDSKGFFTLPLRVAINSIYDRIRDNIVKDNIDKKVGLLHSDFRERYIEKNPEKKTDNNKLAEYMDRTKQFSLPLTICTIDQLFDFVFRASGFELKVATLSYSKIVIDEIQMYSADLLAYLIYGLKYVTDFGGKFAIMTATLPGIVTHLLDEEGVEYITTAPFINDKKRHKIKIMQETINPEFIRGKYENNKILVICNTVKKAKEIYENLKRLDIEAGEINLIHSRFIRKDRGKKEKEISEFADPKRFKENIKAERSKRKYPENGIWIGTQVLEASLDLDFDILITELSDLNGLFQRMGRCYRNREITDEKYNCYVFVEECSGISGKKPVIDEEIHKKSREAIINIDGVLSESEKLELIDKVYSYESLKGTNYFKEVKDNIYKLKYYIIEYEKNKTEVQRIFRNIASYDVIPRIVYEENQEEIDKNIKILEKEYRKINIQEKKALRFEKIKARGVINQFKVSIPEYEYNNLRSSIRNEIETRQIGKYEELIIVNCEYSYEKGIEFIKKERDFDEDYVF